MEQDYGMATPYPRRGQTNPLTEKAFWGARNGSSQPQDSEEVRKAFEEHRQQRRQ